MNILQRHSIVFHFLSFSSFFCHVLSFSFTVLSLCFHCAFTVLSLCFHCAFTVLFYFFLVLLFSRVLKNPFFCLDCLTISYESSYVKNQFGGPSRGGNSFPLFPFFLPFLLFLALPVVDQLVTIWLSVKIRLRVVKGGSSPTFVPESPD